MTHYAVSIAALALALSACAHADPRPASDASPSTPLHEAAVVSFAPPGMSVRSMHAGDLDGDGDGDLLVVLEPSDPTRSEDQPRALMVLVRGENGQWTHAASGMGSLPCAACGGMMGHPLAGVEARTGGFTIRLEGGSRELWSSVFDFEHDAARGTWLLARAELKRLDRLTGESRTRTLTADELGAVPLEQFEPSDIPDF